MNTTLGSFETYSVSRKSIPLVELTSFITVEDRVSTSDLLLKHFASSIFHWICESESMDLASEKKKDHFSVISGPEAISCVLKGE